MTDHMTNNEQLHSQLAQAVGGFSNDVHIDALSKQDVDAISDVQIVNADEDDTDPIEAALTNAVNTPTSVNTTSPNLGLNWGTDGDAALTDWMNRRI